MSNPATVDVVFTADHDHPTPEGRIAYLAGMELPVSKACADAAIALNRARLAEPKTPKATPKPEGAE